MFAGARPGTILDVVESSGTFRIGQCISVAVKNKEIGTSQYKISMGMNLAINDWAVLVNQVDWLI